MQNALEGALAVLCATAAMALAAFVALLLADAGSVGSLWELTMAITAMAVGGSVSSGASASASAEGASGLASLFGGGGMSPSVSGAVEAVPLGVTLIGAAVLWIAFSRRLRRGTPQRRFSGSELAVRVSGAATAAMILFMFVAGLGRGTAELPASAMEGMGGLGGSASDGDSSNNPFSALMGGDAGSDPFSQLMGGDAAAQPTVTYDAGVFATSFGALVWAVVVLGVGCLISQRVRLPLGGALDRARTVWAPTVSTIVRTVLTLAGICLTAMAVIGLAVGGQARTAAGIALLVAPNLLAVFLSLGVGAPWTAEVHPVSTDNSSNPLAGLMEGMTGGGTSAAIQQPDHTEHLRSLSAGGWQVWLVALAVTCLILISCAYRASRTTGVVRGVPLHPYKGPMPAHLGTAERFALATAVVLGATTWLAGGTGNFSISVFGSAMGGMRAGLGGSVLLSAGFGLFIGGLAGLIGSMLAALQRAPKTA
ncbi:streptophobe family protein [Streptomyces sp. NPDC090106]|uniref:streptophobe family protein n=1 Tax=Streptomyces sp. NPDC090106 TaxID=3365946 RepID=UPI003823DF99